ncbi:quinone oxidoreductase family protein [Streptomyces sp. CA-111067]|uniref:quinone oxidoreductase family protein n=1 Tax=Streptomyces sp. CA-111067 TaxID=3240046 RepID=UPI003D97B3A1
MRRVRFYEYGGPEVLRVEDAEAPEPGPGELLVRTEAIGVTLPSVRKVRGEGGRTPLPGVLGGEVAGTVIALGPDVTDFEVGDRITSLTFSGGSYSELAIAPGSMASRIPDGASAVQAVALVRSGHVALAALATARPLASESVLITGAASGVGHLAVQLAKLQGIERVIAAVSSHTKAEFLRGLGADEIVTYDGENWGEPVDVVLDGVGGDLLPRAVAALAPGGRLVFFNSGGGTVPAFDLLAGSKTITGLTMARFANTQRELYDQHGEELWKLTLSGRLQPAVHARIPLAEAARAHEIIEARANLGKVVLLP